MKKIIYKYFLTRIGLNELKLPTNAKILDVQAQKRKICLWALVDLGQQEIVARTFLVVGTGHEIVLPTNLKFIATVQQANGDLIWHVFEVE